MTAKRIQLSVDQISKLLPAEPRMQLVMAAQTPHPNHRIAAIDRVTEAIRVRYPQFFRNQGVQS